MECTQAPRLSGEVGTMDEALCDYIILLCLGEWSAQRRMVPAATWDSAGMSARPSVIHPGCGHIGSMHNAAVLEGSPFGIPDDKHPRGHTSIAIC